MWRPSGAMWYPLAINPPAFGGVSPRAQSDLEVRRNLSPPPLPRLLLSSLQEGRVPVRGRGADFIPAGGAPGAPLETGASAGFPLCRWLLAAAVLTAVNPREHEQRKHSDVRHPQCSETSHIFRDVFIPDERVDVYYVL